MKSLLVLILIYSLPVFAQTKPFRFAFISDTHIGSPNGGAEEDLRRTVADINRMKEIDFVVLTGDITELGTYSELRLAKLLLDSLSIPYYIIPGNHDTGWSESGGLGFTEVFGKDRFYVRHNGVHFIGCASGPYVRMSDGHVPRDAMNWMKDIIGKIKRDEPIIFLNHYPLDNGLDNWYEVIDLLKSKNTILALCGHGHANRTVTAEGIPSVMGRSNLRAKATEGGYNLVYVRKDSILFTERKPVSESLHTWKVVANQKQQYKNKTFPRPDFSMNRNDSFVRITPAWAYQSSANVISTPVVTDNLVVFGNQQGLVEALGLQDGKRKWKFKTTGPVFSSPAASGNFVVLGSADGFVYALDSRTGKLKWKYGAGAAVLGSPLISGDTVYIGTSAHSFLALHLQKGSSIWTFTGLQGPIVSQAVLGGDKIIFGAWDRHLYALDRNNGSLAWKWNNGSSVINFSPAACIPVIKDSLVYVAAPDRYLTALHLDDGKVVLRTNKAVVRESIGISEDGKFIYGKTMQDTVVAFLTGNHSPEPAWKINAAYGYEHAPSMLIEKEGKLFFGTRNGIVYLLDPSSQKVLGKYRIDNSMVNTVRPLDGRTVLAATMDGKVTLLRSQ